MTIPVTNFDDALAYEKSGQLSAGVESQMAQNQSDAIKADTDAQSLYNLYTSSANGANVIDWAAQMGAKRVNLSAKDIAAIQGKALNAQKQNEVKGFQMNKADRQAGQNTKSKGY